MINFLNQYSYFFASAAAIVALIALLRYRRFSWTVALATAALVAVVAFGAYFVLRPGAGNVNSVQAAEAAINNGKPTLVEFYSNYCAGCMAVRPVIDGVIRDIQTRYPEQFNILQVDIHTEFGRALRERYGFTFSPEFVMFDTRGQEVWRSNFPPNVSEIDRLASGEMSANHAG